MVFLFFLGFVCFGCVYIGGVVRLLIIGGFFVVVFWVYSIVDCVVQLVMWYWGVFKIVWIFIVVFLFVIGGIFWFVIGCWCVNDLGVCFVIVFDDDFVFLCSISKIEQDVCICCFEEEFVCFDEESDEFLVMDQCL